MTFRTRLLILVAMAVLVAVAAAGLVVAGTTRKKFEESEEKRSASLVEQFRREFTRRGVEISERLKGMAGSEAVTTIAVDGAADIDQAGSLARAYGLDFLELVDGSGRILSSAQCAASFGYQQDWLTASVNWNSQPAFLKREDCLDETSLALLAVRVVEAGDRRLYVVGGERLDTNFLKSLTLPAGMRALLYLNLKPGTATGLGAETAKLMPVIEQARKSRREITVTVNPPGDPAGPETIHAVPLTGRQHQFLGALLIASSRRELMQLERFLLWTAVVMGAAGVLLGVMLGWWATARVTRPVKELAEGARAVAHGELDVRVPVRSRDEIGQLAFAFNLMTGQLVEQRDRLVQAERVAAWKDIARQIAHEVKNPLFPIQTSVETLQRAWTRKHPKFEEIFVETTRTVLEEVERLKHIVSEFSRFARLPAPRLVPTDLNGLLHDTAILFRGEPAAGLVIEEALAPDLPPVPLDPTLLGQVANNLVKNAVEAVRGREAPRVLLRSGQVEVAVWFCVEDSGPGVSPERREEIFRPYVTDKEGGTGLGLAIAQRVVLEHGGALRVEDGSLGGARFVVALPVSRPGMGDDGRPQPS